MTSSRPAPFSASSLETTTEQSLSARSRDEPPSLFNHMLLLRAHARLRALAISALATICDHLQEMQYLALEASQNETGALFLQEKFQSYKKKISRLIDGEMGSFVPGASIRLGELFCIKHYQIGSTRREQAQEEEARVAQASGSEKNEPSAPPVLLPLKKALCALLQLEEEDRAKEADFEEDAKVVEYVEALCSYLQEQRIDPHCAIFLPPFSRVFFGRSLDLTTFLGHSAFHQASLPPPNSQVMPCTLDVKASYHVWDLVLCRKEQIEEIRAWRREEEAADHDGEEEEDEFLKLLCAVERGAARGYFTSLEEASDSYLISYSGASIDLVQEDQKLAKGRIFSLAHIDATYASSLDEGIFEPFDQLLGPGKPFASRLFPSYPLLIVLFEEPPLEGLEQLTVDITPAQDITLPRASRHDELPSSPLGHKEQDPKKAREAIFRENPPGFYREERSSTQSRVWQKKPSFSSVSGNNALDQDCAQVDLGIASKSAGEDLDEHREEKEEHGILFPIDSGKKSALFWNAQSMTQGLGDHRFSPLTEEELAWRARQESFTFQNELPQTKQETALWRASDLFDPMCHLLTQESSSKATLTIEQLQGRVGELIEVLTHSQEQLLEEFRATFAEYEEKICS